MAYVLAYDEKLALGRSTSAHNICPRVRQSIEFLQDYELSTNAPQHRQSKLDSIMIPPVLRGGRCHPPPNALSAFPPQIEGCPHPPDCIFMVLDMFFHDF